MSKLQLLNRGIFSPLNTQYKHRSDRLELMDNPDANRAEVDRSLHYIHHVNRLLGGYTALFHGLDQLVKIRPQKKQWKILDLGCGDGRQLIEMKRWSGRRGIDVQFFGLDIDPGSIALAGSNPRLDFANFIAVDALGEGIDYSQYDIITGTLFFHHLKTEQILVLLKRWNNAGVAVLINDLQRSSLAWALFKFFSTITLAPSMARHDGALSVKRAFSSKELKELSTQSGFPHSSLKWKWAFRYLLLLWHE